MNTEKRIEDLEIRITHQDAALEELTRTALQQSRELNNIKLQLEAIREALKNLSPPVAGSAADEPPPPHY